MFVSGRVPEVAKGRLITPTHIHTLWFRGKLCPISEDLWTWSSHGHKYFKSNVKTLAMVHKKKWMINMKVCGTHGRTAWLLSSRRVSLRPVYRPGQLVQHWSKCWMDLWHRRHKGRFPSRQWDWCSRCSRQTDLRRQSNDFSLTWIWEWPLPKYPHGARMPQHIDGQDADCTV